MYAKVPLWSEFQNLKVRDCWLGKYAIGLRPRYANALLPKLLTHSSAIYK
ncbi:MAG: hypothetical protein F6K51_32805 [Moorea sp. SIO3I8]|nr:hypothetical protein [Moorena sp. SIO3I8]